VLVLVNVNMHVNECYMRLPWSQYPVRLRWGRLFDTDTDTDTDFDFVWLIRETGRRNS
jgi:hypothetical protein